MLFNSFIFIFAFLPLVLLGYYGLGKYATPRAAQIWLILASFFYYGWWNPSYLGLIGGLLLGNFVVGRRLMRRPSRSWLGLGLFLNLGALAYYKYANFFVDNVNQLAGSSWVLERIILPLGISFFTFQKIAFLVDAYQGKIKDASFADFCLFVMFFPQLIAGPIVHHSQIIPQFARPETYHFSWKRLALGFSWFTLGLFKKVIIADGLSPYTGAIFSAAGRGVLLSSSEAWVGAISFSLQLYFDFSGYTDMAIGLGLMFGILLPLNFNSPYQAGSIIEFWRRWHMTLSAFLRDYVYIPLGGNRKGEARRYLNLFLTMCIGGIWHGAGWTYFIWGGAHGAALTLNHFFRDHLGVRKWPRVLVGMGWLATFLFVTLAWVLFRAESLPAALIQLQAMVWPTPQLPGAPDLVKSRAWVWCVLLMVLVWVVPNTGRLLGHPALKDEPVLAWMRWRSVTLWAVILGILFALSVLNFSTVSEFLYYQF